MNCDLVITDQNLYRKDFPPMEINGNSPTIKIALAILGIGTIDEIEQTLQLSFNLKLHW